MSSPSDMFGTDVHNYIHGLLDHRKSQFIWLHGTAGVGKSAVAYTVADRMRSLKVREDTKIETRFARTFFFSRKHTKCSTTGHFFCDTCLPACEPFPLDAREQSYLSATILRFWTPTWRYFMLCMPS